ncbi:ABC transporter ATP-binding protein [Spiribacter pallidus]|jgi:NitT/TauT family transport system ATP-binding protein|uniref:ABC transporter ATP-binding protein n=1 Tax=Spiribacter pallidus TaxID=1987936 RepID=UPI0034A037CC
MNTASAVLTANALSVGFDRTPVLTDVSFALQRQKLISVVGASGAGKSTLLRGLAGLLPPLAGSVTLAPQTDPGTRAWSMVFQAPRLFPWRRVRANVELGLEGLGLSAGERRLRAERYLQQVDLLACGDRFPHQLSGGQQQRVGLARALAVEPRVLFMDEPFSALDAITRRRLQQNLIQLRQHTPAAIVFVTHDIEEAVLLSDRVLVLGADSGGPARIRGDIAVDLPSEDRRNASGFRSIVRAVEGMIRTTPHSTDHTDEDPRDAASGFPRPHA